MVLLYPLLIAAAGFLVWQRRADPSGKGCAWFLAWTAAGFMMSFSFITGLSIGLFVLPLAAAWLIWVARRSPHLVEASGFAAGIAVTALLIGSVN